ncbi:MAG TPA: biotin carboxylase N-terminal domain-containing protein [Noviherbaspirillum sp.]
MTQPSTLLVRRDGGALHVTLNQPATRNALSSQMVAELHELARECASDTDSRCIVLRGAGGTFCAGGNFGDFVRLMQSDAKDGVDPIAIANREFGRMLQEWQAVPQVVVVVVEGAAMGGGLGLVAIADIVLAESKAQFAMPETSLGLPPAQIAPFVAQRIGSSHTRRMALTAARIDARQAHSLQLVDEVADGTAALDEALVKTLQAIRRCAPRALASTKAILARGAPGARRSTMPPTGLPRPCAAAMQRKACAPSRKSARQPGQSNADDNMQTILIANRGEIAIRLMRTMRRMGYRTVAVFSDADAGSPHVRMADAACRIGPAPARDSYLDAGAILDAAHRLGADAIHPGYGFLAENADFAATVIAAGLTWIGPPPAAMRSMGNKAGAKRLLVERDVPMLPGYQGKEQSDAVLLSEAVRIGLPLMIKAAAGGGGRGMRLVREEGELASALARARSEAEQAFGSGELILERALFSPRHVEIQVFADLHGNVVHLGERDCSVQRRHQKIIEEAPSPAVTPALRARLGAAAVAAARACGYVGAGTVEFLLDADGAFWFMEMNTRLQVEHTVTEALTGLDLVEWQLRVAEGARLPLDQKDIDARLACGGHAIEVRLCAEDPASDFLPQAGPVLRWRASGGGRTEHALADGYMISPHYDSMVAKLIAHGPTREEARRKLMQQLHETLLLGVRSNQDFLIACLAHPEFAEGRATTSFIASCFPAETRAAQLPDWPARASAAALLLAVRAGRGRYHPELHGWSSTGALEHTLDIELDGTVCQVSIRAVDRGTWRISGEGHAFDAQAAIIDDGELSLRLGDGSTASTATLAYATRDEAIHFRYAGRNHVLRDLTYRPARQKNTGAKDGMIRSPMNGKVAVLQCAAGAKVSAGQTVIVLEAMKMEHAIMAPCDGILRAVHVARGEQVAPGNILAEIDMLV